MGNGSDQEARSFVVYPKIEVFVIHERRFKHWRPIYQQSNGPGKAKKRGFEILALKPR
jgi:hypothetical protein